MNMQVSYDSIIKACEAANIGLSINDINEMLAKDKPMTKPLRRVIDLVIKGEEVKEMAYERKNSFTPAEIHEYDVKMHIILDYLKIEDLSVKQLSDITGLDQKKTAYLCQLLKRRNRIRSYKSGSRSHFWTLYDNEIHKPVEIKTMTKSRQEAKENGEKYYHGSEHYKCGNTLRLTSSGDCMECAKLRDKNRVRTIKKQESTQ